MGPCYPLGMHSPLVSECEQAHCCQAEGCVEYGTAQHSGQRPLTAAAVLPTMTLRCSRTAAALTAQTMLIVLGRDAGMSPADGLHMVQAPALA